MNKTLRIRIRLFLAFAAVGMIGAVSPKTPDEFRIGALLSLTGNWNTLGRASKAAVELAADDVNRYFKDRGISVRIRPIIADTKLQPANAVAQMKKLQYESVHVFIGPQSSAELTALTPIANGTGAIIISQGSTASSLSIELDNVLRMVPDDRREAAALVALLKADGVRAIVPVARVDAGNGGLFSSVTARFASTGGVCSPGVRYEATTSDFGKTLAEISKQASALKSSHPGAKVAVYLAAFDEAAAILAGAKTNSVLSALKWYGSDGVVQSTALTAKADASEFAVRAGYPNPIFGLEDQMVGTWAPLASRIKSRSGIEPDAFALSAYDAVWLAALARAKENSGWDSTRFRNDFTAIAEKYIGVTGPTKLDAAGDRDAGNFDFWGIVGSPGHYTWKRVAVYNASDGTIIRAGNR